MSKVEINIAFSYLFHDKLLIAIWREVSQNRIEEAVYIHSN